MPVGRRRAALGDPGDRRRQDGRECQGGGGDGRRGRPRPRQQPGPVRRAATGIGFSTSSQNDHYNSWVFHKLYKLQLVKTLQKV